MTVYPRHQKSFERVHQQNNKKGYLAAMKIFYGIIIAVVVFVVLSQVMKLCFTSYLNAQKGSHEEVVSGNQRSLKKALIIYQPGISEISSKMAHQIARGLYDGGYEVTLNHPGDYLSADLSEYSILVFGSPAYSGQPSKALTDYLSRIKVSSGSRIILYSTGSFKFFVELGIMESALDDVKVYKKIKFFTNTKSKNDKTAYDLGRELSRNE
jgi:flavorubredoxin